jgi:hypothetical protein
MELPIDVVMIILGKLNDPIPLLITCKDAHMLYYDAYAQQSRGERHVLPMRQPLDRVIRTIHFAERGNLAMVRYRCRTHAFGQPELTDIAFAAARKRQYDIVEYMCARWHTRLMPGVVVDVAAMRGDIRLAEIVISSPYRYIDPAFAGYVKEALVRRLDIDMARLFVRARILPAGILEEIEEGMAMKKRQERWRLFEELGQ